MFREPPFGSEVFVSGLCYSRGHEDPARKTYTSGGEAFEEEHPPPTRPAEGSAHLEEAGAGEGAEDVHGTVSGAVPGHAGGTVVMEG